MDRYIKGLLTAYDRVLNLIDAIDPDHSDLACECLRIRINGSILAYQLFLKKEDLEEFNSELNNKIKALEGSLTETDIMKSFGSFLHDDSHKGKVINLPDNYFNFNSD